MKIVNSADIGAALVDRVGSEFAGGRNSASVAVVGGRTASMYLPAFFSMSLSWSKVSITVADDRLVPASHCDSNFGELKRLVSQTSAAAAKAVPLVTRFDSVSAAAAEAAMRIPKILSGPLDLVVLSLADDGHFASLFPGDRVGIDAGEWCVGIAEPPHPHRHPRVTLTIAALATAKSIALLLAGKAKKRAFAEALRAPDGPMFALASRCGDRLCVIMSE